ncbi:hypothetical protein [Paenibacillus terrigena]|nr:hypothetical protein [Paenibacillus terrigena]
MSRLKHQCCYDWIFHEMISIIGITLKDDMGNMSEVKHMTVTKFIK